MNHDVEQYRRYNGTLRYTHVDALRWWLRVVYSSYNTSTCQKRFDVFIDVFIASMRVGGDHRYALCASFVLLIKLVLLILYLLFTAPTIPWCLCWNPSFSYTIKSQPLLFCINMSVCFLLLVVPLSSLHVLSFLFLVCSVVFVVGYVYFLMCMYARCIYKWYK